MGVVRGEHSYMAYRISTAGPTVYGFRRADSKSLNREPFGMEALSKVSGTRSSNVANSFSKKEKQKMTNHCENILVLHFRRQKVWFSAEILQICATLTVKRSVSLTLIGEKKEVARKK